MKIWIMNHYAICPGSPGGTRHYDLSKVLVENGHEVTIFASSFEHQARVERQQYQKGQDAIEEYRDGIRFVWFRTTPYGRNDWRRVLNIMQYSIRAFRRAKRDEEVPDVVIGSLMHPLAAWIGYRIAKKKKALFYFEERDLWPQTLIDLGKVSKRHPIVLLLGKLELFLYRKSQRIIVLFQHAQDYVRSRRVDARKVLYMPNGVDMERFDSCKYNVLPDEVEHTLSSLKNKWIAIYTGAHGLANGVDRLIEVAKEVGQINTSIHFLFVGDGPEKQKLLNRKEQDQLDNVTFLPPVPKSCIPSLLMRAQVGLLWTGDVEVYKWGISMNKQYDYMAAELPLMLFNEGKWDDLIAPETGISNRSMGDMVQELIYQYSHETERKKLGQQARKYGERHHQWSQLANQLETALEEDQQLMKRQEVAFSKGDNVHESISG